MNFNVPMNQNYSYFIYLNTARPRKIGVHHKKAAIFYTTIVSIITIQFSHI